ncbi:hypothetical protein [Dipodfec virus UOA04_Rod_708]|nr:hypothetical protein [Dipodfec virus UOA04_Rod_708]
MKITSYRYMWLTKGDKSHCCFKILTDCDEAHSQFIDQLNELKDKGEIEKISREYLCEYDCSKLCILEDLDELKEVKDET